GVGSPGLEIEEVDLVARPQDGIRTEAGPATVARRRVEWHGDEHQRGLDRRRSEAEDARRGVAWTFGIERHGDCTVASRQGSGNATSMAVSLLVTQDAIFSGRLRLCQPARGAGYRFNLDPVLLAGFAAGGEHVVDLGAGCGVLGLALLVLGKAERLT